MLPVQILQALPLEILRSAKSAASGWQRFVD